MKNKFLVTREVISKQFSLETANHPTTDQENKSLFMATHMLFYIGLSSPHQSNNSVIKYMAQNMNIVSLWCG